MEKTKHCRLLILGAGPAGYSAAVYAARANLKPVLITGAEPGGQMMTTTDVDNWPGDSEGLLGPVLMERMLQHAQRFKTEIIYDRIDKSDLSKKPFQLFGDNVTYTTGALIIAQVLPLDTLGLKVKKNTKEKAFLPVLLAMDFSIKIKMLLSSVAGMLLLKKHCTYQILQSRLP